jgi:hypothetical protein
VLLVDILDLLQCFPHYLNRLSEQQCMVLNIVSQPQLTGSTHVAV